MSMVTPGVTAVAQDSVELGAAAVRRLLERLEDPAAPAETTVLDVALRLRGSTGPAPAAS
jgi:LacI family transcriptional regulator